MMFTGKHGDTFEMAFAQLLACANQKKNPWVDCAALRCFGFRADGGMEVWFQPLISLPDAAAALSEALAVKLHCERVKEPFRVPENSFMLGPLTDGIAVPELRDSYYHGNGRFLLVKKTQAEQVEVFDPRGFDGLLLPYGELERRLPLQGAFCLWLCGVDESRVSAGPEELLYRGLEYHDNVTSEELCELERVRSNYVANSRNEIALRYGILNMVQQLDKVFSLAEACGWKTSEQYREEKQALFACGFEGDVSELPETVSRIWRILNERR